jgi:hypothetical protein
MRHLAFALALTVAACGAGGGSGLDAPGVPDVAPGDADEETAADLPGDEATTGAPTSYYRIEATFDDGRQMVLGRDVTDRPGIYAFGSTHIAPAVSFAMTDTVYDPYSIVTFNLGIVVGSQQYPVQCDGTGTWSFGTALPPELDLYANNLQFRSRLPGSQGTFEVLRWSVKEGETVEGRVKGRLQFDGVTPHWADVEAEFRFVLPPPS